MNKHLLFVRSEGVGQWMWNDFIVLNLLLVISTLF